MATTSSETFKHYMFCPRCDRKYGSNNKPALLEKVKQHVREQHPDHDPEWYETAE